MNYLERELARGKKIIAARASWTPAEIQVNLDKAEARYATHGTSKHAYEIAAARDRVDATPFLAWIHARGEWERFNEEFQIMLKDIRESDGEWDVELEETRYQASKATKLAYVAVEAQNCTTHIGRLDARPQGLAGFAATPGGQEYMDLAPDADLLVEIADRDRARVAPRHPDQPQYSGRQFSTERA